MAEHRLAGLFFATKPHYLAGSPVLERPGIPRVAVMDSADIPGVKALSPAPGWTERAIELVQQHARRRVAALGQPSQEPLVARALAAAGLEAPSYWFQCVDLRARNGARNAVHLLMSGRGRARPDALLIMDDNLVEPAMAGLVAAGVRVPEDIIVVTHCNFPYPVPCGVPVMRLGYDVAALVAAGLDNLIRQRRGEPVPDVTTIPLIEEAATSDEGLAVAASVPEWKIAVSSEGVLAGSLV